MIKYFFLTLLLCSFFTLKAQDTDYTKMTNLINNGYYTIIIDRAMPMSARMISLTSLYGLDFYKDSVSCYLPYFGRAYGGPMPINPMYGGIRLESHLQDLNTIFNEKKKKATIEFSAIDKNTNDRYRFYITVFSGMNVSISVTSNYRQSISFSGYMASLKN